jgi:hypothetical protein
MKRRNEMTQNVTLTDNVIAHVAQLIQVAILTGTDIVDNLRLAQFTVVNGKLDLSPDYQENFSNNISKLLQEAVTLSSEQVGADNE